MTTQLSSILLGQWQASPRLRGIITDVLQPILDDGLVAAQRIQLMLDIDEAVGIWLDRLGVRVGIRRPTTTDPTLDERFGFDMAGAPFGRAPFRGFASSDALFPLPDPVYRRLVKARTILVMGDGTEQTFSRAVRAIDPQATIIDNRDMTVTVTTTLRAIVEMADNINALPRNAGVRIIYT